MTAIMVELPDKPRLSLTPAGRYWLAAVVGLIATGLLKNINLIVLIAYFLLGMFLINWWIVRRSIRGAFARRHAPPSVFAGEAVAWRLSVENRGRAPIRDFVVRDRVVDTEAAWAIGGLAPGEVLPIGRTLMLGRRGIIEAGPGEITTAAPFGLVVARIDIGLGSPWVVFPRRGSLRWDRLVRRLRATGQGPERRRANVRLLAEGTDLHGLRPYRPGDSPRWVHWKTTARTGELMVREYETGTLPGLIVEVDAAWTTDAKKLEATLSLVATLMWDWSAQPKGTLTVCLPGPLTFAVTNRSQALAALTTLAGLTVARGPTDSPRGRVARLRLGTGSGDGLAIDPTIVSELYVPPGGES